MNRSATERQRGSKGGVCPRDGETSGFWPLGAKWMAFTVEIVRNDSGLFSSGRRFGKIGLGKLAYGKCRFRTPAPPRRRRPRPTAYPRSYNRQGAAKGRQAQARCSPRSARKRAGRREGKWRCPRPAAAANRYGRGLRSRRKYDRRATEARILRRKEGEPGDCSGDGSGRRTNRPRRNRGCWQERPGRAHAVGAIKDAAQRETPGGRRAVALALAGGHSRPAQGAGNLAALPRHRAA